MVRLGQLCGEKMVKFLAPPVSGGELTMFACVSAYANYCPAGSKKIERDKNRDIERDRTFSTSLYPPYQGMFLSISSLSLRPVISLSSYPLAYSCIR